MDLVTVPTWPEQVLDTYLETRDAQRRQRAEEQLGALSTRERRLVSEAAVMGYVQGFQDSPHRDEVPRDRDIILAVLSACDSMGDLYPTLHRAGRRKRAAGGSR